MPNERIITIMTAPHDQHYMLSKRRHHHVFAASIPRYWVNNNPVITCFYNALSTVIPEGEQFFIHSVRVLLDDINDETLKAQVKAFIAQESSHRAGHMALNALIRQHGYPLQQSESYIANMLKMVARIFSPKQQLAITLALEHFSALLTDQFLLRCDLSTNMHADVRHFLLWHCIEETEHKAVAYDVYQTLYGSYVLRIGCMLLVTLLFIPHVALIQCRYLWHERQLFNLPAWLGAVQYFWFKPGWFMRIIPGYFRYFLPSFHPWQHNNRALVKAWLDKLQG